MKYNKKERLMNQGYIKINRDIADSDYWTKEKFTRGQAWIDLLLLTNTKDGFIIVSGEKINIKQGECRWSVRSLASRWKWSRGRVQRCVDEWSENEPLNGPPISQTKYNGITLISVLNYGKYQVVENENVTTKRATKRTTDVTTGKITSRDMCANMIMIDPKDRKGIKGIKGIKEKEDTINCILEKESCLTPISDPISPQESILKIKDIWNNFARECGLPKVIKLGKNRVEAIKKRSKEPEFDLNEIFENIRIAPFLLGKTKERFLANFDFVFFRKSEEGTFYYIKILEGNYKENFKSDEISKIVQEFSKGRKEDEIHELFKKCDDCGDVEMLPEGER